MKIIDETKVKKEISKIEKVVNGKLSTAFEKGVEFAETELQTLAIEFAEWLLKNKCKPFDSLYWEHTQFFTTKELFKVFIEQRNK